MSKHGGKREGSGRKPKMDEQAIVDMLSPLEEDWLNALTRGIQQTQGWAVKLYAEYYMGKPKERVEVSSEEGIKNITFTVVKSNVDTDE
tara:strand:+ start:1508 stop:1774 length:267 start_codon:yes stop_codon:yes gene_type:complete